MNKLLAGLSVLLGVALVGSVVVVGLAVSRPVKVDVNVAPPLGVVSGNEFDQGIRVSAFESKDGSITNGTSLTLTAREICEDNLVSFSLTGALNAVTLPSAPLLTAQCFDRPEAMRTLLLRNATSGLSSAEILAGASSTLYSLLTASTSEAESLIGATTTLSKGAVGRLTGVRITSSTPWILWTFEAFR